MKEPDETGEGDAKAKHANKSKPKRILARENAAGALVMYDPDKVKARGAKAESVTVPYQADASVGVLKSDLEPQLQAFDDLDAVLDDDKHMVRLRGTAQWCLPQHQQVFADSNPILGSHQGLVFCCWRVPWLTTSILIPMALRFSSLAFSYHRNRLTKSRSVP